MGVWGYYQPPLEPPEKPDWQVEEDMAEIESLEEFIETEMSYDDWREGNLYACEDIATDEGGWGAWMGGEL